MYLEFNINKKSKHKSMDRKGSTDKNRRGAERKPAPRPSKEKLKAILKKDSNSDSSFGSDSDFDDIDNSAVYGYQDKS